MAAMGGPWTTVLANASATDQNPDGLVSLVFPSAVSTADHPRWRISILCRRQKDTAGCDPSFSHSWIKEIKFRRAGGPAPSKAATQYQLWYLPYTTTGSATGISIMAHYAPLDTTKASPAWLQANGLTAETLKDGSFRKRLPEAASWSIGAEDSFESFAPMELPASAAEQAATIASSPAGSAALFFPEDRRFPLKMLDQPPGRWMAATAAAAGTDLNGTAQPGELFAFQLGIWAVRKPVTLSPATVTWTDLSPGGGDAMAATIPRANVTCSNIGGIDFRGRAFTQSKTIAQGALGSLWLLVPVPANAAPGTEYTGKLTVEQHDFDIVLTVNESATAPIPNAGADDLWRMARLGWLDSTIGIDRSVSAPYRPVTVAAGASPIVVGVSQHNRSVSFGGAGSGSGYSLVDAISVAGKPVLAAPITVAVDGDTIVGGAPALASHDDAGATIIRRGQSAGKKDFCINSTVEVSYDGYIEVAIALQATGASASTELRSVSVTWTLPVAAATYAMGLGKNGYTRSTTYPTGINFNWTADNTNNGRNQLWVGNYNRGYGNVFNCDSRTTHVLFGVWG